MRRALITTLTVSATLAAAVAAPTFASADPAPSGPTAVGLVGDDKLVRIDLAEGGKTRGGPRVSGLFGDTGLIGIDFRPFDGQLYGVGDRGGVYTLSQGGNATKVSQLTVALQGSSFGVDFNPAADRLRIISDTGQNLRHNIDRDLVPPAVAGPTAPGPGQTAIDGPLSRTGVTGAGYINNDNSATTTTTLYDIDTKLDELVLQNPPNAGTLTTVGKLGVDTGSVTGFDVFSTRDAQGSAISNAAYAVLTVGGAPALYSIDLVSGAATPLGRLDKAVTDIAVTY